MPSRVRLLSMGAVAALVFVGLTVTSADAAVAKVTGVASAGQDYTNAKLKARWKGVPGATYQVRWASSTKRLAKAKVYPARSASALSPVLNRCITNYVQVRAVKGSSVGKWSKAKGLRFSAKRPARATMSGVGLDNAVQFNWGAVPYATRYRVRWNAAPFGKFPGAETFVDRTSGGWTSKRSSTLNLPTTPRAGDKMMGVAYANAVFAQIQTNNSCRPDGTPTSSYIPVFPKAPSPGPGDKIRFAVYNVELAPRDSDVADRPKLNAIAGTIADRGVQVVALQEASQDTVASLGTRLGGNWSAVPIANGNEQRIMYRNDVFQLTPSGGPGVQGIHYGSFAVASPKGGTLNMPWVKLLQKNPSDNKSQAVMAVSVHFTENANASNLQQKASTGVQAAASIRAINAINTGGLPVIVGGDLRYKREPFCDAPKCAVEAPPTFVRSGYYDAMAAQTKIGFQYASLNNHTRSNQAVSLSGVGVRADHIMLKGFRSSVRYENVANRFMPGTSKLTPSDHNMILADVVIPYAP